MSGAGARSPRTGSPGPFEQRAVEEGDDACLVRARASVNTPDMLRLVDLPQGLGLESGLEVLRIQLLAASSSTGVDQKDRTRSNPCYEAVECRGRRRPG